MYLAFPPRQYASILAINLQAKPKDVYRQTWFSPIVFCFHTLTEQEGKVQEEMKTFSS